MSSRTVLARSKRRATFAGPARPSRVRNVVSLSTRASGGGEPVDVALGDDEAFHAVLDHLWHATDRSRDHRQAERHRLDEHRRQRVLVAVASGDERRGEHGRLAHRAEHPVARCRTHELDGVAQTEQRDHRPEVRLLLAFTDDDAVAPRGGDG